jgi:hypothetical protein
MQDFAHRIGDMLALIAETLQSADFEELKKHGVGDDGPAGGRSAAPAAGTRAGGGTTPG